jgi:hypothetical protein
MDTCARALGLFQAFSRRLGRLLPLAASEKNSESGPLLKWCLLPKKVKVKFSPPPRHEDPGCKATSDTEELVRQIPKVVETAATRNSEMDPVAVT